MSETNDRNITMFTALVAKLTEDIKLSKNREEHIELTARANEAAELLKVFEGIAENERLAALE